MAIILEVVFSTDRVREGKLTVKDTNLPAGQQVVGTFTALGKSDNKMAAKHGNPKRNPEQPYGDTPTGSYEVISYVRTGPGTTYASRTYGPEGAFALKPASGQALVASANGRIGLMIHGGDLNAADKLRPTHGCIRLSNADMKKLVELVKFGSYSSGLRCETVRIDATVGEESTSESPDDVGDPPPGMVEIINSGGPVVLP